MKTIQATNSIKGGPRMHVGMGRTSTMRPIQATGNIKGGTLKVD